MAYKTFWEAYAAKNPTSPYTPAGQTWTPANQQALANAESAVRPTWTPPTAANAALPNPIKPVVFDPYGDVGYAAGASAVTNANNHAQAQYDYQGHRLGQQYGYDATGNLITSGADLNPYAEAAIMKRNYDNSVRGTNNSYASQGQLYAGSLVNAQNNNAFNYGASSDQLKRGAQDAYHSNALNLQGTQDAGVAQLAALLGPAFANFLAGQRGS